MCIEQRIKYIGELDQSSNFKNTGCRLEEMLGLKIVGTINVRILSYKLSTSVAKMRAMPYYIGSQLVLLLHEIPVHEEKKKRRGKEGKEHQTRNTQQIVFCFFSSQFFLQFRVCITKPGPSTPISIFAFPKHHLIPHSNHNSRYPAKLICCCLCLGGLSQHEPAPSYRLKHCYPAPG